ncbi:Ketol-acid reductoisomerase [Caloramator mitchellensis]|uniref:Ketol-acid reductoisomerase n=2 Tax=Caloramator mitchellensis TaxID=908809 RepID=A0A0R3JT90_CALMK|nr:Ketol-acid reductoisomerase [Caloramator mitchellensis]
MKIGFIGAGKVGSAFGRYLKENGLDIAGFYSRSIESSQSAAEFTGSKAMDIEELVNDCNYIFITTPDGVISEVWERIKKYDLKGKNIFHMSGCLGSDIFQGAKHLDADTYSLHPLFPFTDRNCFTFLNEVVFSVEGENIDKIKYFLNAAKLKYFVIDNKNKAKYHAAAVFASNYIVSIAKIAKEILLDCGMDEKYIVDAIYPLMKGAVSNIREKGIEGALTGPILRRDAGTIKLHLDNLDDFEHIYRLLGLAAVEIEKGKIEYKDEKLEAIENLLRGE